MKIRMDEAFRDLLYPLATEEFDALRASIEADGVQVPVVVDERGVILDGHHRFLIAKEATPFRIVEGLSLAEKRAMVFQANFARRNLSPEQKAELRGKMRVVARELRDEGRTQEQIGRMLGVDQTSVSRWLDINDMQSHNTYDARIKLPDGIHQTVFDRVSSGETQQQIAADLGVTQPRVSQIVSQEKSRRKREERRAELTELAETADDPLSAGATFSTIVIDPPWDWGDESDVDQFGRARPTYATLSLPELMELPVGRLSDKDAHIYLWITNRSLPKGFGLLDRWGFRYVTCLTWCKPSFGMGNYFRGQTEHILFGVRGSLPLLRRDVGTWFEWNRGPAGHSSKPPELLDLVETCSPGPYLEMFSRSKRDGWSSWGCEL